MANLPVTGVAGYIAPRPLQAIRDTGNRVRAALETFGLPIYAELGSVAIERRAGVGESFFATAPAGARCA